MASMGFFEAFLAFFGFLIFYYFLHNFYYLRTKKSTQSFFWSWPVLGMLPGVLLRVVVNQKFGLDDAIKIMEETNLNFLFKGPWFTGMDCLITVDPANIHHIFTTNFHNYVKGKDLLEMFDVYGDTVFNIDPDQWKDKRMTFHSLANHQGFHKLSMNTTTSKLKEVLVPLFDRFAKEGTVVDMQDVIGRFTFDTILITSFGYDPCSLSFEMPEMNEFAKSLEVVAQGVIYRHVIPRFMLKLQKWMGVGQEKKMSEASATIERVCAKFIEDKREALRSQGVTHHSREEGEDILTSAVKISNIGDDKFVRDIILTSAVAGRDTVSAALTWFFWCMSENPKVVANIRQEINANLPRSGSGLESSSSIYPKEFLNKLVYLHAALCESMRLNSPVPFERKTSVKQDVIPSGHKIEANSTILFSLYALGKMKAVWGEDALEYKPERWVSETGGLRHEPSFKFLVFNAGPRICVGKHLAMNLMKIVAIEILQNFDMKVVEGHKIEPMPGLNLLMKHGLRVTLTRRCSV